MHLPDPFIVPTLHAGELELTGYRSADAEWVTRLAGPLEVTRFTGLPHPMPLEAAEHWVRRMLDRVDSLSGLGWVARLRGEPMGAGTLRLRPDEGIARLGFWLGQAYWGRGYGRAIAQTLTEYAFESLQVRRLEADCVSENVGSVKVLQSCGLRVEGLLRGGFHRFGESHDVTIFGALRSDRRDSDSE